MTTTIPQELIEKALALTGKTMEDMNHIDEYTCVHANLLGIFSIEKFAYYLLSPEFIEEFIKATKVFWFFNGTTPEWESEEFWNAIYEYQKWNPEPLIELLKKI